MTHQESDREDLMREAVALTQRMELRCQTFDDVVTLGFRDSGALSVFIGQDPVYQFDPEARLRRAFVGGLLYRSQHHTLAQLTRLRSNGRTILVRIDLANEDLLAFRMAMCQQLTALLGEIRTAAQFESCCEVLRAIGDPDELLVRVTQVLAQILSHRPDWLSPQIRARK